MVRSPLPNSSGGIGLAKAALSETTKSSTSEAVAPPSAINEPRMSEQKTARRLSNSLVFIQGQLRPARLILGSIPSDSMDMEMRVRVPERSFLASLFLGHLDISVFAGGGRARTGILAKIPAPSTPSVWSAGPFWYHQLLQWDSEWYFKIVTEGYRYNGDPTVQQNIVFYPLYPMLARGLAAISGLDACGCAAAGVERRGHCWRSSLFSSWFARNSAINSLSPPSRCSAFFRPRSCCRPGIPNPWNCS